MKYAEISATALFLALLFCPAFAYAGPVDSWPAKPDKYVTDMANLIESGREIELNGFLQELEEKTGVQFVVVTVESLEGETKESFALAIAEHWKIGTKGRDDGLVFLLAKKERAYRFETGYGLEGLLPDGYIGQLGRERLVPYLKEGKYSQGILVASVTIIDTIAQDRGVTIVGIPEIRQMRGKSGSGFGSVISMIIFFLFFSSLFGGARARSGRGLNRWRGGSLPFWALLMGGMMGGRRGPRIGGGGGFGSFGGGMGGGFGGGGAGGNW